MAPPLNVFRQETKEQVLGQTDYKKDSYSELIKKATVVDKLHDNDVQLLKSAVDAIEKARTRIKTGRFISLDEAKLKLK